MDKDLGIIYIKCAFTYRYCCEYGSWPISKAEAEKYISSWTLDHGWTVETAEDDWRKVWVPHEVKKA